jgi:hypothetical protein
MFGLASEAWKGKGINRKMLNRTENVEPSMEFDPPPVYTFSDPHSSTSPESSTQRSSNMETELKHIVIAVMGVTGAGKSHFVQRATGADVEIGHSQASCRSLLCM